MSMGKQKYKNLLILSLGISVLFLYFKFVWGINGYKKGQSIKNQFPDQMKNHVDKISKAIADNRSLLNQLRSHVAELKQEYKNRKTVTLPPPAVQPRTQPKLNIQPKETIIKSAVKKPDQKIINKPAIESPRKDKTNTPPIIPVLLMACNRPSVTRSLDLLLKYKESFDSDLFPIIVSQDGGHQETKDAILGYGDKIMYMQHTMLNDNIPQKHFNLKGYYKLAAHYKWALNEIFSKVPGADAVIIVEDDLEIAPDFFSYFQALHPLLEDPTLMCVSAWNDNGKTNLIDISNGETTLYRSDFFPGLGWMLSKKFWNELEPKWPAAFWDDWLREPSQRLQRSCIRPEISRTKTFGRVGVSNGQFYDKHLKFIQLNDKPVDWSKLDLSYLHKDNYDKNFFNKISQLPAVSVDELQSTTSKEVKVQYSSAATFKAIARVLGIMDDFKSGVPRTAYHGVVTTLFNGIHVYVVPGQTWKGYDSSWS